jgi:hypothetical protein
MSNIGNDRLSVMDPEILHYDSIVKNRSIIQPNEKQYNLDG